MNRRTALRYSAAIVAPLLVLWLVGSAMLCEGTLHGRPTAAPNMELLAGRFPETTWREVNITAQDGVQLDAYFVRPATGPADAGCVVVLHGIGDSRGAGAVGFVPMLRGYSVLLPDIRAHGTSGGDLITFGVREKDDVLRWVRWLRDEQHCGHIYGLGESLGGAILIQAAGVDPGAFDAIVAESAFADLRSIAEYRVSQQVPAWLARPLVAGSLWYAWARYGLDLWQASPAMAIAKAKTPILLIHGLADTATPPEHSQRIAAAGDATLWLVPSAQHTSASAAAPREFHDRVLAWFKPRR